MSVRTLAIAALAIAIQTRVAMWLGANGWLLHVPQFVATLLCWEGLLLFWPRE